MKIIFFSIFVLVNCIVMHAQSLYTVGDDYTYLKWRQKSLKQDTLASLFRSMVWIDETEKLDNELFGQIGNFIFSPLLFESVYNSTYPRSFNDGALWAGKGASFLISSGVSYKNKSFEVIFNPLLTFSQNSAFEMSSIAYNAQENYYHPWRENLDFPQRFGESSLWGFNLGDTRIKYTVKNNFYVSISNESMWWGPSYNNPILMSNTASGIPHISIGSDRLLPTKIGHFGFAFYWGQMQLSKYYHDNDVTKKYFTGLTFEYAPSFVKGLTLGFGRVLYNETSIRNLQFKDFLVTLAQFKVLPDSTGRNDNYDQLGSLYLKWQFPKSGFEFFVEFNRNDFASNIKDLLLRQPDHSRFYSIGFSKLFEQKRGDFMFSTEFNVLSRSFTQFTRASPVLYVHDFINGSYTQGGQLVGAGIGPGSTSQLIAGHWFREEKSLGIFLQRITYDDDQYFKNAQSNEDPPRDVEASLGFEFNKQYTTRTLSMTMVLSLREAFYLEQRKDQFNLLLNVRLVQSLFKNSKEVSP